MSLGYLPPRRSSTSRPAIPQRPNPPRTIRLSTSTRSIPAVLDVPFQTQATHCIESVLRHSNDALSVLSRGRPLPASACDCNARMDIDPSTLDSLLFKMVPALRGTVKGRAFQLLLRELTGDGRSYEGHKVEDGKYVVEHGGGLEAENTCFQSHSENTCPECGGRGNKCFCHGEGHLVTQSTWKFFVVGGASALPATPAGFDLYIKSEISLVELIYDYTGHIVGIRFRDVPPEYWLLDNHGKAVSDDCHNLGVEFDKCWRCRMKLIVVTYLSLCAVEAPKGNTNMFSGPGGMEKKYGHTGPAPNQDYPETAKGYMDHGWSFDPGEIEPKAGFAGSLRYHTDLKHCSDCKDPIDPPPPDRLPEDPPPPDTGGGTPTTPETSGGGAIPPSGSGSGGTSATPGTGGVRREVPSVTSADRGLSSVGESGARGMAND